MNMEQTTQEVINECYSAGTAEARLLALLRDPRFLVRANAMISLGTRRLVDEFRVTNALLQAALAVPDGAKPVFGTMTEQMIAGYALHGINTAESHRVLEQVEALLTSTEIEDLRWNITHNPIHQLAPTPDSPPSTPRG